MLKWVWVTVLGIFLCGCEVEREVSSEPLHEQIAPKTPIDMPEHPDFAPAIAAAQPKDGVYSTWGVVFHRKELLNTVIRVRGKIVDVSEDCPQLTHPRGRKSRHKAQKAQEASRCYSISVVIATEGGAHKIRVAGYHPFYHPHLKPGMELEVTGEYVENANLFGMTYIEPDNGLIIAHVLHGMGVNRAGVFTTNRAEISEMIANGTLLEVKHPTKEAK